MAPKTLAQRLRSHADSYTSWVADLRSAADILEQNHNNSDLQEMAGVCARTTSRAVILSVLEAVYTMGRESVLTAPYTETEIERLQALAANGGREVDTPADLD